MLQNALPAVGLLVLMMLVAWMLQRYKKHLPGRLGQQGTAMQVTGGLSLGPQHRLVSVRIGEGAEAVHMVLGVAPGSITTVATVPASATPGADTPTTGQGTSDKTDGFAARLAAISRPKEDA